MAQRTLLVDGEPARLGARAFDVLAALIERRDRVVGKNELLEVVWPHLVVEENNLQVQISALRKLLGPDVIATIPGRGYKFTAVLEGDEQPAPAQAAEGTAPSAPLRSAHAHQPAGRAGAAVRPRGRRASGAAAAAGASAGDHRRGRRHRQDACGARRWRMRCASSFAQGCG